MKVFAVIMQLFYNHWIDSELSLDHWSGTKQTDK